MNAALLLLADGRLPIGGHVHSGGIEAAWVDGRVADLDAAAEFVVGRLHTVGVAEAALVAALVARLGRGPAGGGRAADPLVAATAAEAAARRPGAPLRDASRRLGRQLVRVAGRWSDTAAVTAFREVHPGGPHQVTALGAIADAAGSSVRDAALLSLHHQATTPIQAVVKLGGLDPFAAAELTARLGPALDELADVAADLADGPLDELPCASGPLTEIAAVEHAARTERLFAT